LTQPATIFYQAKTVLPERNMQASFCLAPLPWWLMISVLHW